MDQISLNPMNSTEQSKSKTWFVISIVVVLVIIAFGLYFWRSVVISNTENTTELNDEIQALNKQDSSDGVASIEKDLQATNLDNLDKEVPSIGGELDAVSAK